MELKVKINGEWQTLQKVVFRNATDTGSVIVPITDIEEISICK